MLCGVKLLLYSGKKASKRDVRSSSQAFVVQLDEVKKKEAELSPTNY